MFECKRPRSDARQQQQAGDPLLLPGKCQSLPRRYKQTVFTRHPQHAAKVDPQEFRRRLETIRQWVGEFSDRQMTVLVAALFPHLGAAQLHFLSSQLPPGPGLHHLCAPGCSDPLSLLPDHVSLHILAMLPPSDLATASRVCSTWRHLALTSSLWQALCRYGKINLPHFYI